METTDKIQITIEALVKAPIEKVWNCWTAPKHISKWNHASDDWHTTYAENDLQVGGKFLSRMEAKDGSFGFDFIGVYDQIIPHQLIAYTLEDGRKVKAIFTVVEGGIKLIETFEAENENSIELQTKRRLASHLEQF